MTQSVWHVDDVARIAATLMAMAPSEDFAAGVMALADAVGATVKPPRRPWWRETAPVMIDVPSTEVQS